MKVDWLAKTNSERRRFPQEAIILPSNLETLWMRLMGRNPPSTSIFIFYAMITIFVAAQRSSWIVSQHVWKKYANEVFQTRSLFKRKLKIVFLSAHRKGSSKAEISLAWYPARPN
jgi:hypothetical protein